MSHFLQIPMFGLWEFQRCLLDDAGSFSHLKLNIDYENWMLSNVLLEDDSDIIFFYFMFFPQC